MQIWSLHSEKGLVGNKSWFSIACLSLMHFSLFHSPMEFFCFFFFFEKVSSKLTIYYWHCSSFDRNMLPPSLAQRSVHTDDAIADIILFRSGHTVIWVQDMQWCGYNCAPLACPFVGIGGSTGHAVMWAQLHSSCTSFLELVDWQDVW